MNTFSISLRALKHPWTLSSITLLLINDHILKAAYPSVLTGKVSDFAGLFFFPFLLAAVLSILLIRFQWSSRRIAGLAFTLTLVWFSATKTISIANMLTIEVVSFLLNKPAQILLDPSDLVALVVLWPAWALWQTIEQEPVSQNPGKLAYFSLGLAAIASMATSPMKIGSITRLVVYEGKVIAFDSSLDGDLYESSNGLDWTTVDSETLPDEIITLLQETAQLPVTVCDPENLQICYRTGPEIVEQSADGGKTWEVAWEIPPGRREFMEMYLKRFILPGKSSIDLGPYDLALLSNNGKTTLVVASGNEGILVKTPDDVWKRLNVGYTRLTPFAVTSVGEGFYKLFGEILLVFLTSTLTWIGFSIWGARKLLEKEEILEGNSTIWVSKRYILSIAVFGIFVVCMILTIMLLDYAFLLSIVYLLLIIFGGVYAWARVKSIYPRPGVVNNVMAKCILLSFCLIPSTLLPFVAWVLGYIPFYGIAVGISLLIGLTSMVWGTRAIRRAVNS